MVHGMKMQQVATEFYDTHAAVRQLTESGLSERQAEAVVRQQVELLKHNLATKDQVAKLQAEVEKVWAEVEKVWAEVEKLRLETKANIEVAKTGIIMWVTGLNAALIGLAVAILRFT